MSQMPYYYRPKGPKKSLDRTNITITLEKAADKALPAMLPLGISHNITPNHSLLNNLSGYMTVNCRRLISRLQLPDDK